MGSRRAGRVPPLRVLTASRKQILGRGRDSARPEFSAHMRGVGHNTGADTMNKYDKRVIAAALQALPDPDSGIRPSRRRLAVLVRDSRNLQSDESRCAPRSPAALFCIHQIQMSLFLPFTDVTVTVAEVGRRAGVKPWRSAAPDRRLIDWSSQPHPLFYRASARSLGS
jgi:hypothetical protein